MRIVLLMLLFLNSCSFIFERSEEDKLKALQLIDQGTLHLREGNLEDAKASFILSNDINESAAATDGLGCVSFMKQDYIEAEKLYIKAYRMEDNYFNSLANLALLYEQTHSKKEARKLYELAVNANPTNFKIRSNFGAFLYDNYSKNSDESALGKEELYKAKNILPAKIITDNIKLIEENHGS